MEGSKESPLQAFAANLGPQSTKTQIPLNDLQDPDVESIGRVESLKGFASTGGDERPRNHATGTKKED